MVGCGENLDRRTAPNIRRLVSSRSGAEWWERWSEGWHRWLAGERWRSKALLLAGIGAAAVAVVASAVNDRFAAGAHVWIPCWLMLLGWLLITPTKTVRWASVLRLFSLSAIWAVAIAWLSIRLSHNVGLRAGAAGPSIGIAAAMEETLKLLPLVVIGVLAPGRLRRFSAADWLLLGLAAGMGFQASEDFVRQATSRPTILNPAGTDWRYGWTLFGGRFDIAHITSYAGHQIETALVAAGIGIAVRLGGRRTRWRWVWALPVALWAIVVCDHIAFNAVADNSRALPSGRSTVPNVVRSVWSWSGHGFNRGWLLLLLLGVALLLDARSQAEPRGAAPAEPTSPLSGATALERTVAAVAEAVRALMEVVATTARGTRAAWEHSAGAPGRARVTAMFSALTRDRQRRELLGAPLTTGRPWWPTRLVVATTGITCTAAGVLAARSLAQRIGETQNASGGHWFGGLLDGLARWWDGLGLGGQLLVGAGVVALILLGGFLLFPELFGVSALAAEEAAAVAEGEALAAEEAAAAAEGAAAEGGAAEGTAAETAETAASQGRLEELARDPAHGGRITEGSAQEARAAQGLEDSGQLPRVQRDPTGGADFIDETGQAWDVKGFNSQYPKGYDLESATTKIATSLRDGENVILDTTKMSPADVSELRSAVEANPDWAGKILWWP